MGFVIVVIIAGGSGTRLWPLSTPNYPKHLLKLTNDHSLLQNTFNRAAQVTSQDKIFVVSEVSHIEHVYKQLADLSKENILTEPARRGTASCVVYALSEIKKRNFSCDEPILFLWADHLIRDVDGFVAAALRAGEIAESTNRLVFIGIKPTYPATGLGYMQRNGKVKGWQDVYELASFKEKPDHKTAEQYLRNGKYFWNTGYLVGNIKTLERDLQKKAKKLWKGYQSLLANKDITKAYLKLKSEPIDTALSERITDGIVLPVSFDWIDVGSFRDLHGVSLQDDEGNHVWGNATELENTTNSYVRNDTDTPVAVIGLDNVVVVNTPNGVLVVNKNYAQAVGEVSKKFKR